MKFPTAICERTGKDILLEDGFLVASPKDGEWSFISVDAGELPGDYCIKLSDLLKSPQAFTDWMGHLNEKTWLEPTKFFDFWSRFRRANNLYKGS